MTAKELLAGQSLNAHHWINRLMDTIPENKWGIVSTNLNTSMKWQIGHLVTSAYYHAILVITGPQKKVMETLPMKKYSEYFTFGNQMSQIDDAFSADDLKAAMKFIQDEVIATLNALPEDALKENLFPLPFEHPIAKVKVDALSWYIKHTMWHGGQIAILARQLEHPFDFGLKEKMTKGKG